jgi:hypothetical protein
MWKKLKKQLPLLEQDRVARGVWGGDPNDNRIAF